MELQVLCVAAQEGDLQAVAAWLDKGGGVDERCAEHEGATLLFAAAYGGQEAMVRMLLAGRMNRCKTYKWACINVDRM